MFEYHLYQLKIKSNNCFDFDLFSLENERHSSNIFSQNPHTNTC